MKPRLVSGVVATLALAGAAQAHRPLSPRSFSDGLEARDSSASAAPVVGLRTPASPTVFIPGGTFRMGSLPHEAAAALRLCELEPAGAVCQSLERRGEGPIQLEMPAHMVTIASFSMDRTEVTVEAYGRCVATGACGPAGIPAFDPRFDRPELPVTHVRWDDARDYCTFAKGRLPTEAEWEYAARGPSSNDSATTPRAFPWGNVYNPHVCNHGSLATTDPTDASDGYAGLAPAGALRDGATPLGLCDMAGNVAEWVQDQIVQDPSGFAPYPAGPQKNPVVTQGTHHIARGGSYRTPSYTVRGAARAPLSGAVRHADVGMRCAYDAR